MNKFDKSKHQLVLAPDPILDTKVDPFPTQDVEYRTAVSEYMQEIMQHFDGIGLAANQINLNAAVFTMYLKGELVTMFNPEITKYGEKTMLMKEGCLSFPGMALSVKRPTLIEVQWEDENDEVHNDILAGLDCRVFLHEFDHIHGICFTHPSRVGKVKLEAAKRRQKKLLAQI